MHEFFFTIKPATTVINSIMAYAVLNRSQRKTPKTHCAFTYMLMMKSISFLLFASLLFVAEASVVHLSFANAAESETARGLGGVVKTPDNSSGGALQEVKPLEQEPPPSTQHSKTLHFKKNELFAYSLLAQSSLGSQPFQVMENSALQSGDLYKIYFTPNHDAYVYIFQVDSSGNLYQLFPPRSFSANPALQNPVSRGKTYVLPGPQESYQLDHNTGTEKVFFFVSKTSNPELERLYQNTLKADSSHYSSNVEQFEEYALSRGISPASDSALQPLAWDSQNQACSTNARMILGSAASGATHVFTFKHN